MAEWLKHVPGGQSGQTWWRLRNRRRQLKRTLDEIRRSFQPRFDAPKTEDEDQALVAEFLDECREYDEQLSALEWNALKRKAMKFGIDVPGLFVRPNRQYTDLRRQITEARFAYWERWANILVPTLSLLVALAALFWHAPPCSPQP